MKLKTILIYTCLAVCLFCSCNLDYASSTVSTTIADSKEKGFFLAECKIDSIAVLDKTKPFLVKHVWIEKSHTSAMSTWGKETFQTDSNFVQVVFDLDSNSCFTSDNFNNWIISSEKKYLGSLEGNMISLPLSNQGDLGSIRFKVYSLKTPGVFNYDTVKVVEFALKKH